MKSYPGITKCFEACSNALRNTALKGHLCFHETRQASPVLTDPPCADSNSFVTSIIFSLSIFYNGVSKLCPVQK